MRGPRRWSLVVAVTGVITSGCVAEPTVPAGRGTGLSSDAQMIRLGQMLREVDA